MNGRVIAPPPFDAARPSKDRSPPYACLYPAGEQDAMSGQLQAAIGERALPQSVPVDRQPLPITISLGATATEGGRTLCPLELLGQADEKLYEAKRCGRNRTVALGAVAVVLLLGLSNMARSGSPHRSQKLMQLRVLLQFIAIIVIMLTIWVIGMNK